MKKNLLIMALAMIVPLLLLSFAPGDTRHPSTDSYVVIAWNDLGMHCANKDFSNMCILPPYNNSSFALL